MTRSRAVPSRGSSPAPAGHLRRLSARIGRDWHLAVLACWTAGWFVILAPRQGIAWKFFIEGTALLFGGPPGNFHHPGGLDLYASYPQLQIGPLAFLMAAALRHLGLDEGLVTAQVVLTAAGVVLVGAIERLARVMRPELTAGPRARALRLTVLAGGAVFLIAWVELSVAYTHLDDGLALILSVAAVWAVIDRHPVLAGACIGLAADAKPWALVVLPILLVAPWRTWLASAAAAVAAVAAAWLPFLVADPGTMAALHYTIANMPDSALRALGVADPVTPSWDRSAQIALGCALGAVAVWRKRWPAVVLLGIGARVALDPGVHGYYTAGIMVGALLWDTLGARRPFPLWSLAGFAALNLAPLLTHDAPLLGQLRLWLVIAVTVALLATPARWCWPARPTRPVPDLTSARVRRPATRGAA